MMPLRITGRLGAMPLSQIIRFGLGGLLNTLFGYALFLVMLKIGVSPNQALVVGTVAGILFNFQTAQRLVFRRRGLLVRFALVYVGLLGVNWAALALLTHVGLPPWEAQGVLMLPIAGLSFVGQRGLVFRPTDAAA